MGTEPDVVAFVTRRVLAASQLPCQLTDANGTITRPREWA